MAVYTPLVEADAERVAEAHGLGALLRVEPVAAGSVNSNFFLHTERGRFFLRIYEEQGPEGAAREWALLEHLKEAGLRVPERVPGPPAGALCVADKVVAVFVEVGGTESCQASVSPARAREVGAFLARAHRAAEGLATLPQDRFGLDRMAAEIERVTALDRPELREVMAELREVTEEIRSAPLSGVPRGLVHGDLFRDNVRWEGEEIEAVLDWESASEGPYVFDLAVSILAWCYGDAMRWDLARAMAEGYLSIRPMEEAERRALRPAALRAAARFTTTRVTDFHLRTAGIGERVMKDYRRFWARLRAVRALDATELAHRIFG